MFGRIVRTICMLLALAAAAHAVLSAGTGSVIVEAHVIAAGLAIVVLVAISAAVGRSLRRQWSVILLVVLATTGLLLMGLVVSLSSDQYLAGGLVDHVCGPEGHLSRCQEAVSSRWSSLPIGLGADAARVPLALLGVVFYGLLLMWFLIVGRPTRAERLWHLVPLCLTAAGTCSGFYLTIIMFTRLSGPCPFCLSGHLVTAGMFIVTGLTWPKPERVEAVTASTQSTSMLASGLRTLGRPALAILFAGIVCLLMLGVRREVFNRQQVVAWDLLPDDSVRGPTSAPFVAIVYSDFRCGQCGRLARTLEGVQRRFPGRLRIVFRHFPLTRECNPLTRSRHPGHSCQAARAAEAARRLGGDPAFWKMHDALFSHQSELDGQPYAKLAEQIGLDPERLVAEMDSPQTWQRVATHIESSKDFHIRSTPTLFLNGRRLWRWSSMAYWQAVFDAPGVTEPTESASLMRPSPGLPLSRVAQDL